MNISKSFIEKPIFASVLSLLIFILGFISIWNLPVSEYPEVAPPSVVVRAIFPGASPKVISETVATTLEEQINGVENMLYMNSQATTDGVLNITVTFKLGTNPDLAQQMVQNRVSQALPRLPEEVRRLGVTTIKSSPDLTMVVHLLSPNERYDTLYLRNYALLNVKDELKKIQGVGQVEIFGGGDYAMRVWLNPDKMAEMKLVPSDVIAAISEQNLQVAAGTIGAFPAPETVEVTLTVNAKGRLHNVEEFENIIIKSNESGGLTKLKDIARVELGASDYALRSLLDNKPAVALAIFQMAGSNAIAISDSVRSTMKKLQKTMPEGVKFDIVYDPTVFVRDSIEAVIKTLIEAIILVVIVVIIFLQTWRASIIPLLAVPVSIIGTFLFLHFFGFSINALSLFGLVLAIGIVVDDAIVVVENVERNIEAGLTPRQATHKAMDEVSGPIIAIALTLCAVFIPIAFISGLTGQFYKQFALTIAISTVISAFNSLTLSPALCAILLKGHNEKKDRLTVLMEKLFGWFFNWFNRFFANASKSYGNNVVGVLHRKGLSVFIYFILIVTTYFAFQVVPPGYVPAQDKQYLVGFAQLPDGATIDRSEEIMRKMSDIMLKEPGIESAVAFPGLSINGFTVSSSAGIVFATLKPFSERKSPTLSGFAIAGSLQQKFMTIEDAFIAIFPPPPVQGLGTIGGFRLQIQDKADQGFEALDAVTKEVTGKAWSNPKLAGVFSSYKINVPQLEANLDREKAKQLGLNIADIFNTMQVYLGSLYVNDFNKFGRTYQVIAQADAEFRAEPEDINNLKVRNNKGEMIPLGAVLKVTPSYGPESSSRYNGFRTADINGGPNFGVSSGEAELEMEKILDETLPKGMSYEWTELKYQQILAGNSALYIFPLCVLLVFMVLAAQYESLTLPFAVILIVPMCLLSAIIGVFLWGSDNNIFTQISLFVLIGLACKNAILIVEFAHELERQGRSIVDAAIEACRLRLRPILMTSIAFIAGVIPLVISSGAGSEMRQAMGIAVFSGMLGVTIFGLFLTPVFYVLLRTLAEKFNKNK